MRIVHRIIFLVSIITLLVQSSYSQGFNNSSFPFLTDVTTAAEFSLNGAYTSLPSSSTTAAFYNPAQLGFEQDYKFALSFAPHNSSSINSITFRNYALRFNSNTKLGGKTLHYGASFILNQEDYGRIKLTSIEQPEGYGSTWLVYYSSKLSFGASIELFSGIDFLVGYSLNYFDVNHISIEFERLLHDFGSIIVLNPLDVLDFKTSNYNLQPILEYRFGSSIRNLGNPYSYSDEEFGGMANANNIAMPHQLSIGHSATLGIKSDLFSIPIQLLTVDMSRDVFDLLQKNFSENQSIFDSDISLSRNLLSGKSNVLVSVSEGLRFTVSETFEVSYGRNSYQYHNYNYEANGTYSIETNTLINRRKGFAFRLTGIKKLYLDSHFPFLKPYSMNFYWASQKMDNLNNISIIQNPVFWSVELTYSF
jgi:hypothetical protein